MQQPDDTLRTARGSSSRLRRDLAWLGLVGVVLLLATFAGSASLYQQFYSPSAFVERYLTLLADGRASDALHVPGVALTSEDMMHAGIDASASDALLRNTALAPLRDIEVVEEHTDGDVTFVTVSYVAGIHHGTTTFHVERDGRLGIAPAWRFAQSPLAVIELTVRGSDQFVVNGFPLDRRQVAALGVESSPLESVPLLVFSPGLYTVSVDTAIAKTSGVSVLADAPMVSTRVDIQAHATAEFVSVVQDRVEDFLLACAEQKVLQPTACPFGYLEPNRIVGEPSWSIKTMPVIAVVPDGADWRIRPAEAVAELQVEVQTIYDGTVEQTVTDVPFTVTGSIAILADGSASIVINGPDSAP